jgi:archaeal cell division control protein 6
MAKTEEAFTFSDFRDLAKKNSVFKNFDKLEFSYVPEEKLYCRNNALKELFYNFRDVLVSEKTSKNILLLGGGGFGKTTIARYFGRNLKQLALENNYKLDDFFVEYFNCLTFKSTSHIARQLLAQLTYGSGRGFSEDEAIKAILSTLRNRKQYLFLIIDEIHNLSENDLLSLLNMQETFNKENTRLSMLLISRNSQWYEIETEKILSRLTAKIELQFYNFEEVYTILEERAKKAFKEDVISQKALETLTEIVIKTKNLRHGIDILRRAGQFADKNNLKEIGPLVMKRFKTQAYSQFYEKIEHLHNSVKITLLAILECIRASNQRKTIVNESYRRYQELCEKFQIRAHVKMTFRKYCRDLIENKLIKSRMEKVKKGKGRLNKFTPYHDEVDVFCKMLNQSLMNQFKNILEETRDEN